MDYVTEKTSVCSEQGSELAKQLDSNLALFYTRKDFIKRGRHSILFLMLLEKQLRKLSGLSLERKVDL